MIGGGAMRRVLVAGVLALSTIVCTPALAQVVGSVIDPVGDLFDLFGFVVETDPDILSVSALGCPRQGTASITVAFNGPISPPLQLPNVDSVFGQIEIGVDPSPVPGATSLIDGLSMAVGYPPNGLSPAGVNFVLILQDYDPGTGTIPLEEAVSQNSRGNVTVVFDPTSYTVTIPLALLGSADGHFKLAVMAQPFTFMYQDVAPNGANLESEVPAACVPPPPLDSDRDGIPNTVDNCPYVPNQDQHDNDGDTVGDVCDNCIGDFNKYQSDGNGNGVGDVCDTGTPEDWVAKQARLKADVQASSFQDGTILVKGILDTAVYGGVDGLRDALRQGFCVNITGAGLETPGQTLVFPRCPSVSACTGTDGEAASFFRKGATDLFDVKVQAWSRSFPPPLTSQAVTVTLSLGELDRAADVSRCRVLGRRGRTTNCKK